MSFLLAILSNQFGRIAIAALTAFLFGWFTGFGAVPKVDVNAIVRNTTDTCNAKWQIALDKMEKEHEIAIQNAVTASNAIANIPAVPAERMRICSTDRNCRGKK